MVSIISACGDRHSVMYQHRMDQVKSPIIGAQIPTYNKNPRTNMDSTSSNNFQSTSGYVQHQNRNIQNSNVQGNTRVSRLHNQNINAGPLNGDAKAVHTRSASMPEAVYLKVHHHQQQTAVVPPNHFQPLELPHQQHYQGGPTTNPYNQRLVPAQLALAPAPQSITKPMLPHVSQYYGPFIKVHPKPYPSSNYSQHTIYGPLPHQPQHPSVSLRRSQTNAGDYLGRRREAKLSTFHGKSHPSPTLRALSPHLQTSSGLLSRGTHLPDQLDHIINLDGSIQNVSRIGYGAVRPSIGLARSRSNIAAIGGVSGLPLNQHRGIERDPLMQQAINLRPQQIGRRSNLARATSFYQPSATAAKTLSHDEFHTQNSGHMRSTSMLASMSSGLPTTVGEKNFSHSRKIIGKDICKPLHVDCSIEYDLGNQPKIPKDSAPLLIIHPAYHTMRHGNEDRASGFTCEETKKLTRSAPPKTNKYQQNNTQFRNGRGVTRHSSFAFPSSSNHASRKLIPFNLENEFHSNMLPEHMFNKKGSSLAYSKSSSNLGNINAHRRISTDNGNAFSKQMKLEARYAEPKEKRLLDKDKESVHLSMLDITIENDLRNEEGKYTFVETNCTDKHTGRKCASVVRRGTSITASSKPTFPLDPIKDIPRKMTTKHSAKPKQQPKAKLNVNGKLTAARKSSTGSRDSGAASSLEADSSGGFNSFLSTMTVVSSLGSSGIGECKRDISLSNKESLSPSPEPESTNENGLTRLKTMNGGVNQRLANSVNTQYRDEAQINFNNKAVTKIKITNQETLDAHPLASNNVPMSTTNVKLIQNRFTQQVQNLSNNFCDSGLGTPSSLNDTKNPIESNRGDSGSTMISTTPNGQISSSMIESVSNNSSTQNTNSSKGPYGYALKDYANTSSSSTASKWKSSMSGLVNGFLCCSVRHRTNSYSSTASSPNLEFNSYVEPRGCKTEGKSSRGRHQPLRKYFVNSSSMSPKDRRTVEAQLAHYNWPRGYIGQNGLSSKDSFPIEKSSEFNSLESSQPSSSITVIPPQGENWNTVLSNPNYSQNALIYEAQTQVTDNGNTMTPSEGISITHKEQINRRSPWMKSYVEQKVSIEENNAAQTNIRISSPSMSTSNTSSGEGLGSSVISSGSSTSNPSSLSQSTGHFAKHKVLVEGRSDSSSSSTSSSSSLSSSSGTANFTPPNNFHRESIVRGCLNPHNSKDGRTPGMISVDENVTYPENKTLDESRFVVENDNKNDNIHSNCRADGYTSYYWNGGKIDNNETYSTPSSHQGTRSKRNSAILISSTNMKEMHHNQNYPSTPMPPGVSSQQNNVHNLTINANFMRPIHI